MKCPKCGYTEKKRSLDQNSISHEWYFQLSKRYPQDDSQGWKRYCKLHFGVPILRADDEEYRVFYDKFIKQYSYEDKLKAMDFLPVTSLMKTIQFSKYLERMKEEWNFLEFPEIVSPMQEIKEINQ